MFSSDMGKIIELQGQYIDRVNRNAAKLNKQLQFLVNIGEQIGGASEETKLIDTLKVQDKAIADAMELQTKKTEELGESIKKIIASYATLKTTSGDSSTKVTELMAYLNELKGNNEKRIKGFTEVNSQLDNKDITEALDESKVSSTKSDNKTDSSYASVTKTNNTPVTKSDLIRQGGEKINTKENPDNKGIKR